MKFTNMRKIGRPVFLCSIHEFGDPSSGGVESFGRYGIKDSSILKEDILG